MSARICAPTPENTKGRGYCGRSNDRTEKHWGAVTCQDCKAARRADDEARRRS